MAYPTLSKLIEDAIEDLFRDHMFDEIREQLKGYKVQISFVKELEIK